MGCCISCCVFLPPGRSSFNPQPGYSVSDRDITEHPGFASLITKDGVAVPAVHFKPNEPRPQPQILLYCHGNAVDLGQMIEVLQSFADVLGAHVVGFEYPGYGLTDASATPSEKGCISAAETALDWIKTRLQMPADRVILFGQSLGSGPAVDLASRHECGGLILFSPLLSAIRTQTCGCFAATCRCGDYFTSIYKAEKIKCRCLIVHGRNDEVVPFSHGEELHRLMKKPHDPVWIDGAGHNDLLEVAGTQIQAAIAKFLEACQKDASDAVAYQHQNLDGDEGFRGEAMPVF
eukprot:TRINITY_DN9516_c0_g1_i1.p1 TRINITY_DN9516_c0_g1~~TRINITY_DN9516_c0_g1_i1.p1  ORF type:complete len:291 (-),score=62.07 TRINITY_DN9516_c0_g1_i1:161-1033(-)